jgi:hypothetical protein
MKKFIFSVEVESASIEDLSDLLDEKVSTKSELMDAAFKCWSNVYKNTINRSEDSFTLAGMNRFLKVSLTEKDTEF